MEGITEKQRMRLTENNVIKVFDKCTYSYEEVHNENEQIDCIEVQGIVNNFYFNPDTLNTEKPNIEAMLSQLPDGFKEGYSFLALCNNKDGHHWTRLHTIMEYLMVLGIAIGRMHYCFPRSLWDGLPGHMPYIIIKD